MQTILKPLHSLCVAKIEVKKSLARMKEVAALGQGDLGLLTENTRVHCLPCLPKEGDPTRTPEENPRASKVPLRH